jgi:glycerophosphoryl diester phosphodiesterase
VNPPFLIIAHRGSSGEAPENTLAAFLQADRDRADMVELDVRLSLDGGLVVFHDRRLGRTAPGWRRINAVPSEGLQELDAGRWFGERFTGERIPSLRDVLDHLPHRTGVNVEVKTDGDRARRGLLASRLASELRTERRRLLVSSFDHHFLRIFRRHRPDIPLGVLYMAVRDLRLRPSTLARRSGAGTFICSAAQLRRRFCRDAGQHGMTVLAYGVNTRRHLQRALRLGVHGVITDVPRTIRSLVTHL